MKFVGGPQTFYTEMVFGSRKTGTANEARISDKVQTKTQVVDFVNAWLPDAEVEPLAGRTLPHEFYSLGSFLALSTLCHHQRLEPERHQDSMHGCVRLIEEFEKIRVQLKYRNRQMVIHPRSKAIVETCTVKKTVKPKSQSYKLVAQPSHRQNGAEFREESRDDSVNFSAGFILMQCCQNPVPTGLPHFPLSQPDEAMTDGFKLSTMKRASDFPCALESLSDVPSFWSEEPKVKSPFFAPLPSNREEQAVPSEILSSQNPSEYGNFESDMSGNGYFGNLTKEQATPSLSTTTSRERIVPSADPSNSFTEYFFWKPFPNWSTKNLLFQLTDLIADMYNLLPKGQEVLSSSIVQPRLEEKSGPDQDYRNSYWPLSSLILLLNI